MAPPRFDLMKIYQARNPAVFGSGGVTMRLPTDFGLPGPNAGMPEGKRAKAKATTPAVDIPAYTYSNPFTGAVPDPIIAARANAMATGGKWQLGKGWVAGTTVSSNGQASLPALKMLFPTGLGLIALKMRNQNLMV